MAPLCQPLEKRWAQESGAQGAYRQAGDRHKGKSPEHMCSPRMRGEAPRTPAKARAEGGSPPWRAPPTQGKGCLCRLRAKGRCYRLSCVPPSTPSPKDMLKSYLPPSTCERDLIWKSDYCRMQLVEKRPYWTWVSPKSGGIGTLRRRERERRGEGHAEEKAEARVMQQQAKGCRQPQSWERQDGPSPVAFRGSVALPMP